MQSVFVKVTLCSDENMLEKSSQMFSELNDVKYFHDLVGFIKRANIPCHISAIPISSHPSWHEGCWQNDEEGSD